MIDFEPNYRALGRAGLEPFVPALRHTIEHKLEAGHGDFPRWQSALANLPEITPGLIRLDVDRPQIGTGNDADASQKRSLEVALRALHPWRKGPFEIFGLHIDSEWRSDMKWRRVANRISPLQDRLVLDVGSGNGYYALRMIGAGARFVLAVDPTWLFVAQFAALNKYVSSDRVVVAPLAMEELPANMGIFDTVFSMGVLYHRRSPITHLHELLVALRPGGELVLETLVIEPSHAQLMLPEDRYAKMRNVWFIPTTDLLQQWLVYAGFIDTAVIDTVTTTIEEQRSTEWMHFESLSSYLDSDDPSLTIEGLPAPRRAILTAKKPDLSGAPLPGI